MASNSMSVADSNAHSTIPMHEQALRHHLSNYRNQLMSIDGRVNVAISGPGDTMVPSLPIQQRATRSGRAKPKPEKLIRKSIRKGRPQEHQIDKQQNKLPMHEFGEITSAFCDIHMILTHLVGIEMTQSASLRRHAEALEDMALHTVIGLTDVGLSADERNATFTEFLNFKDLFKEVSKMLLRGGPGSALEQQRRTRLEILQPGCDGLARTFEMLKIEEAMVDEAVMQLT